MIDIRQTPQYAKYLKKTGWIVEEIGNTYYFIKKFPIIGSVVKIQRPEEIKTKTIESLAKKYRAFRIIVEPKNELDAKHLTSMGYKRSKSPFLPSKTLHLDLTKSNSYLQENLAKDARYALRKTKDTPFQKSRNLGKFRNYWKNAVKLKRYVPSVYKLKALKKSFPKHPPLFLTSHNGGAGAIFLKSNKIAYYWQAFTSKAARTSLAQYRLVWEGILWGKKNGAKIFDFEGIYDSRFPNKSWKGFTHFKRSFGGKEKEYPGAFTKIRLPI